MSQSPSTARGKMIRAVLARTILPRLTPGDYVPPVRLLASVCRISQARMAYHVRRMLDEHGVITERRNDPHGTVVISLPAKKERTF